MTPNFLYGTAWKEDQTSECVFNALQVGYRGIDTANQRKHYNEIGVGEGLLRAYKKLNLQRSDLFLQTKFTFARGQDHRKPFNDTDPYPKQVRSSFESSLKHLHTDYLDSLVLHGPFSHNEITNEDKEVWRAMELLHNEGLVRHLGISNVSVDQLKAFYNFAQVKPKFAQIRCFAVNKWEKQHRDFCNEHDILFQGFSVLTANRQFLNLTYENIEGRTTPKFYFAKPSDSSSLLGKIIAATGKNPAQIIFKFCHQIGILPITGTTSIENMRLDLELDDFELNDAQIQQIENIAFISNEPHRP